MYDWIHLLRQRLPIIRKLFQKMESHPLVVYACEHGTLPITPHIGGCTVESMARTESFLVERLLMLLKRDVMI